MSAEEIEIAALKARISELTAKIDQLRPLLSEVDVSGPSLKLYFQNEEERHVTVMVAAKHGMTLPQYAKACLVKITQDYLDSQSAAAAAAEAEAANENTGETVNQAVGDGAGVQTDAASQTDNTPESREDPEE